MSGRPIEILLVEDDAAHAEIVRRGFAKSRLANQVQHVSDGQAALDYLALSFTDPANAPRPDIILLDLRLPKVDGIEVLRRIKEDPATRAIAVVILTTSKAEQDIVRAYSNYANSYLAKPVDFGQFSELMNAFGFYWLAWNRFPQLDPGTVMP